ncbi:hypothetical protein L9F63_020570, partial [Diploptera punctata]
TIVLQFVLHYRLCFVEFNNLLYPIFSEQVSHIRNSYFLFLSYQRDRRRRKSFFLPQQMIVLLSLITFVRYMLLPSLFILSLNVCLSYRNVDGQYTRHRSI